MADDASTTDPPGTASAPPGPDCPADVPSAAGIRRRRVAAVFRSSAGVAWRGACWLVLIATVVAAAHYGVVLRAWAWDQTETIRFRGDVSNGYRQGTRVVNAARRLARRPGGAVTWGEFTTAYLGDYAAVVNEAPGGDYRLDYAPGRLLVMSLWVKHLREQTPPVDRWANTYAVNAPLLRLNTTVEAATAVAMAALVRHWRRARFRRRWRPAWRHPMREWPPVLAGLAVWFNPAMIWNAHVWPQWDVWLLPFFVLAVLAASKNCWLVAGFLMTAGAAFKGQGLIVVPVLLLWPVLGGRPLAAVRFLIGGVLLAAVVALPWMVRTDAAVTWLGWMVPATATGLIVFGWRRRFDRASVVAAVLITLVIACAVFRPAEPEIYALVVALILLNVALPWALPRRWLLPAGAFAFAVAVFTAGMAFDGRFEWFEVGYQFPQRHYPYMSVSAWNLPRLLAEAPYGWGLADVVALPGGTQVTMRSLLIGLYAVTILPCGAAAAVHARRRSPRVLVALTVPWVLMFTIMPQMHERYLMWGAVVTCAGLGVSVGCGLLAAAVTVIAWANMAASTLQDDLNLLPMLSQLLYNILPQSAPVLMLLAAVCLYAALVPDAKPDEGGMLGTEFDDAAVAKAQAKSRRSIRMKTRNASLRLEDPAA